ncbi:GTP-binding protein [Halovivax sp.]|uniref:CobW family GTP-binding protein n=1 Tax=Halovivax sp. TaxID=1935978 RepID=UPI0025B8B05F|nr:GTP-binding protein [Halovivax sp.]
MAERVPVTILSGALGAGKTTTLNHLLEHNDGRSIAVLVNDVGEINVDAELLSTGDALTDASGIAELSNGCICCERQDDLETEVTRLAREYEFDYLVVEASGISEPEPIARLFTTESRAAARYDVDTTVTVVDGRSFHDAFAGDGTLERETAPGEAERPLADLLIEQVEFSDVVLCNKCDLLSETERERVAELVRAIRPDAKVVPTTFGAVDPGDVLGTGRFDPLEAGERAGWKRAYDRIAGDEAAAGGREGEGHDHGRGHDHEHDHGRGHDHEHDHGQGHDHRTPEEVYGITSFAYRRDRPLHPDRLVAFLESLPDGVVRAKGRFWVAGRDDVVQVLHVAGPSIRVESEGRWIASLPERERSLYRDNRPTDRWHPEWGDREVRLVFIGRDLDEDRLVAELDECLATESEREAVAGADHPYPGVEDDAFVVR